MIVYKYKSLGDSTCSLEQEKQLGYLKDIYMNNQLYAADFNVLDDPMEGVFRSNEARDNIIIQEILNRKRMMYICSLSPTYRSMLMWSFYANYHKGCCIEVEIEDGELRTVEYHENPVNIDVRQLNELDSTEKTKAILSRKYKDWGFEKEIRVLSSNHFVPVTVRKIIFGMRVNDNLYVQTKHEIEQFNTKIEVFKMDATMFDHIDTTDI